MTSFTLIRCRVRLHFHNLTSDFFQHKILVCTITDVQPVRDNDDRIEESRSVPVSEDGHKSHCGKLFDSKRNEIAPKSFVLKDSTYKSFRIKDRLGIPPNSMIPKGRGEGVGGTKE